MHIFLAQFLWNSHPLFHPKWTYAWTGYSSPLWQALISEKSKFMQTICSRCPLQMYCCFLMEVKHKASLSMMNETLSAKHCFHWSFCMTCEKIHHRWQPLSTLLLGRTAWWQEKTKFMCFDYKHTWWGWFSNLLACDKLCGCTYVYLLFSGMVQNGLNLWTWIKDVHHHFPFYLYTIFICTSSQNYKCPGNLLDKASFCPNCCCCIPCNKLALEYEKQYG